MSPRLAPLLLLALALAVGCGGASAPTTPAQLERALARAAAVEVWLPADAPASEGAFAERVRAAARTLAQRSGRDVHVRAAGEAADLALPRVVLGAPDEARVKALLVAAGAAPSEAGALTWNGLALQGQGDVLTACFEDPERPGLPLNLFVAATPRDLVGVLDDLAPRARPGLRFLRRNAGAIETGLRVDGRLLAPGAEFPAGPEWLAERAPAGVPVRYEAGLDAARVAAFVASTRDTLARLLARSDVAPSGYHELCLVADGARARELAGSGPQHERVEVAGRSVLCATSGAATDAGAAAARLALRDAWGEPAEAWMLDGAALDAADAWYGRPLEAWGAFLAARGLVPSLAELRDAAAVDRVSQHVLAPLRALLWRRARAGREADAQRALWRGEVPLELDDASFRAWLAARPVTALVARPLATEGFVRGVTYASDARPGGGFDGPGLEASLAEARWAGANAVLVESFQAPAALASRAPGGALPAGREALEGDAALARALAAARDAGARTVALAPRLLTSDSAGYAHFQRRVTLADWQAFHAEYDALVVHYALLAELCGADVLVLGPDVASPTTGHGLPAEIAEYRAQALRATAARARACFSGALAYCASWPAEVLEFGAWDAFDLVGVAWFPAAPKGAEDALVQFWRAELGRVEAAVARAGKPWMLLETGVRSTSGASLDARFGRGPADGAAQARALRALARVLTELGNEGRAPDGLFWWHWDAAADAPGAGPRGYSPQGKPGLGLFEGLGAGR